MAGSRRFTRLQVPAFFPPQFSLLNPLGMVHLQTALVKARRLQQLSTRSRMCNAYLHLWARVNNAAMKVHKPVFAWRPIFRYLWGVRLSLGLESPPEKWEDGTSCFLELFQLTCLWILALEKVQVGKWVWVWRLQYLPFSLSLSLSLSVSLFPGLLKHGNFYHLG